MTFRDYRFLEAVTVMNQCLYIVPNPINVLKYNLFCHIQDSLPTGTAVINDPTDLQITVIEIYWIDSILL